MTNNLIRIQSEYKDKKTGDIKRTFDYYLEFPNGDYIAIQPKWNKNSNDFVRLRALSDLKDRR